MSLKCRKACKYRNLNGCGTFLVLWGENVDVVWKAKKIFNNFCPFEICFLLNKCKDILMLFGLRKGAV